MSRRIWRILTTCTLSLTIVAMTCSIGARDLSVNATNTTEVAESRSLFTLTQFAGATEEQLIPYFERIEQSMQAYSRALYTDAADFPDVPLQTTDEIRTVLQNKLTYETTLRGEVTILNDTYTITDWTMVDNALVCVVDTLVEYRYPNVSFDSASRRYYQIVLKNAENPVIVDWYEEDPGSFDSKVRTYLMDMTDSANWLKSQDMPAIEQKCADNLAIAEYNNQR